MNPKTEIPLIRLALEELGTPERGAGEKRYLKSDLEFLGVTVPRTRALARRWSKEHPDLQRSELIALVRALWQEPVHELRSFGNDLLALRLDLLRQESPERAVALVEELLREANTWAHADYLGVQVLGALMVQEPNLAELLDPWVGDEALWVRRSSLLGLLPSLRRDPEMWPRFRRYSDALLDEREFFLRKAIGWVLREFAKREPALVAEFLREQMDRTSGVTFREAVRHLPEAEKADLEKGFKASRGRYREILRQGA